MTLGVTLRGVKAGGFLVGGTVFFVVLTRFTYYSFDGGDVKLEDRFEVFLRLEYGSTLFVLSGLYEGYDFVGVDETRNDGLRYGVFTRFLGFYHYGLDFVYGVGKGRGTGKATYVGVDYGIAFRGLRTTGFRIFTSDGGRIVGDFNGHSTYTRVFDNVGLFGN